MNNISKALLIVAEHMRDSSYSEKYHDTEAVILSYAADEIDRLIEYKNLVHFIASDYYELSFEKIKSQRDDWKKRCQKIIEKDAVHE